MQISMGHNNRIITPWLNKDFGAEAGISGKNN